MSFFFKAPDTGNEEISITEKKQENKIDGQRTSQEATESRPLQPQNCKNKRHCFKKIARGHYVPEWQQPWKVVPWALVHRH